MLHTSSFNPKVCGNRGESLTTHTLLRARMMVVNDDLTYTVQVTSEQIWGDLAQTRADPAVPFRSISTIAPAAC